MAFDVLSAEGEDARRWTALVNNLPTQRRDIHFLPEYGRIYRDSYGFEPLLAVYSNGDGYVIQPLVRRPLTDLPFLAGAADAGAYTDIANPYGYGGPLSNAADPGIGQRLYTRYAEAFTAWCNAQELASEFASLHPFMADHQLGLIGQTLAPRHEKDVVFIDLSLGEKAIFAGINRGHRSSLNKARRAGVQIKKVPPSARNLDIFNEIYRETMLRRKAAARWFVPDTYFSNCCRHLGPNRISMFFAFVGDVVECAYLLMHDFGVAYYHFASTRAQFPELRANNLTMYETALWAQRAGYARYHLGGGVTSREGDTLLRFKAGFSDLRAPLYTYFCIRDKAVYDRLCERKRAYELATAGAESQSDFVPIYRR
jgi:Acetyltransferase (GNAT) domain